jgi:hypothetical protein
MITLLGSGSDTEEGSWSQSKLAQCHRLVMMDIGD